MEFEMRRAAFVRRRQRFFADVVFADGEEIVAHCANTGSMSTLIVPGAAAWLRHVPNPKRKLAWTLMLLGVGDAKYAMVDTSIANRIVAEGVDLGLVPEMSGYASRRAEVLAFPGTRFDLALYRDGDDQPACFVEIKNVTMRSATHAGRADFPDARTERGRKHLAALADLVRSGVRAIQFYLVSRSDCDSCGIADGIDPEYAESLRAAIAAGVEVIAYRADISPQRITVGRRCAFECA